MATAVVEAFNKDFSFLKYRAVDSHQEETVTVKRTAYWCYCGPLLDPFSSPDPDSALPANFLRICRYINSLLVSKGLKHYMLTIRATTPTPEYDRPRWHTDELFFSDLSKGNLPGTRLGLKSQYKNGERNSGTNWKICTTLLGPSTLFIPLEHQASARKRQEKCTGIS
ncbi:hypothetical protein CEP52_006872 [Fusarium oligoseptatum]|uniref:Uncharacterized protein n=1 Tax=Fusarium oligoseptatum TaxID=2604345 RepID=A0A428TQJ8_9HYPO|nr:hypothetical protein CEP52_006872 [Fusarium oligoseptatum]